MIVENFKEQLLVESLGNKWVLRKQFNFYYSKDGIVKRYVAIPEGFVTDFVSTPRILYPIFPPVGIYNKAAMIHDYLYSTAEVSRSDADLFFLQAMEVLGVPKWKRDLMYYAVRLFGASHYKN